MFAPKLSFDSLRNVFLSAIFSISIFAHGAEPAAKDSQAPEIFPASDEAEIAIKRFKVSEGFKIELFAAEPMLANPVCFAFDEKGNAYVVETFRHTDGTVDNRKHMNWLEEDIASQSLEDQLAKIRKYAGQLPDMTRESEKISLVQDTDGDGKADKFTIFAEGFTNALDGIAAGVLPRKGDVYFACIPSLYLLRDNNGDGKADEKKVLQTGYGVRFAFIGHDLHGLKIGPDGKLYFSIGDRGLNVKQGDRDIAFTEGGAVLRCNLDGSDLEIFAYGYRNPQELAFDDYGNLFTGDNNADGGDQARWVYIVEGADAGWRVGWQYITEPNKLGPWNSEQMWLPEKAAQIGYIVPPLANIGNGPSGLMHYPGVGLPEKYNGHFFLADFRGTASRSVIHTFANKPKGAAFELVNREDFLTGMLATDVEIGPDCNLYASDWAEGWPKPGKGRLYRIASTNAPETELMVEAKKLIGEGMDHRSTDELVKLLSHRDQRVRQEAQFSLAAKNENAIPVLIKVAQKNPNQLARIHGIWGLGQIARSKGSISVGARNSALNALVGLLSDSDPEIRAQSAKVLGDARYAKAYKPLIKMVQNVNEPRGQFFATQALGKLGDRRATKAIIEMLRANNDQDPFLRHAGVTALVWISDADAISAAAKDNSPAVRLAAVVAMRRLHYAEVASLLHDKQQNVVVEAARAINDLPILEALPELAKLIEQPNYDEPLFRRVLNANYRLGKPENATALANLAARSEAPANLRAEALWMLSHWEKPPGLDRVTGLWRPIAERDAQPAIAAVRPKLDELLKSDSAEVKLAALEFAEDYKLGDMSEQLFALVSDAALDAKVRVEALKLLAEGKNSKLSEALEIAAADKNEILRKEALALKAKLNPNDATSALVKALESGTTGEKQSAFATLGAMKGNAADEILSTWLTKLLAGKVQPELQLDLLQAAAKRSTKQIKNKLAKFDAQRGSGDLAQFKECLAGGNADEGKKVFFERVEASCVRCHKIKGEGGEVGPILDGIGSRKTREYLLNSIVNPNAEIAAGFESVTLTLKNGTIVAGTLKSETDSEVVINSPEDGIVNVKKNEIQKRDRGLSGMPPELAKVLSKQDLRNVVEFLAGLK